MAGKGNETDPGAAMGVVLGFIGAVLGYAKSHEAGGAIAGGLAGFFLGMAVVRFIKNAVIMALVALGLIIAWHRFTASTGVGTDRAPPLPLPPIPPTPASKPAPSAVPGTPVHFVNDCHREIRLFVRWLTPAQLWRAGGSWRVLGKQSIVLNVNGEGPIAAASPFVYYYAYDPGSNYHWHGPNRIMYNNRELPMRFEKLESENGRFLLSLRCDNFASETR